MVEEICEKRRDHLAVRLHMVGNAHIDPMWIWDWREGMHEVLQTFRSAVDRLDEEPALVFTASSASYYHWVEQTSPGLFCQAVSRCAVSCCTASDTWQSTSG
jgi:alpha-mannosidase